MTSGIDFFLNQRIQSREDHAEGWEWYVLDSERLQQDILHIFLNQSPEFGRSLFDIDCKCTRQPERGLFDLRVESNLNQRVFIEIKSDQAWSSDQKVRQQDFLLKDTSYRCAVILFYQQATKYTKYDVASIGDQFYKISYNEIYIALDTLLQSAAPPELHELAAGYKSALQKQEFRTKYYWPDKDPNN